MKKDLKTNKISEKKPKLNSKGDKRGTSQASLNNLKEMQTKGGPGRGKGKLNWDTMVDLAMEALAIKFVEQHNAKKENKNKQITLDDVDIEKDIFMQAIQKARNGNDKMIIDFQDRRYGKATQRVELTGKDGGAITHEMQVKEAEERIRRFQSKWFKTPNKK